MTLDDLIRELSFRKEWVEFLLNPSYENAHNIWKFDDILIVNNIEFSIECGSTKVVLVPLDPNLYGYVLKFPYLRQRNFKMTNYCEKEVNIYKHVSKHYGKYFAYCEYVTKIYNTPMYKMNYYDADPDKNFEAISKILEEDSYNTTWEFNNSRFFGNVYDEIECLGLDESPIFCILYDILSESEAQNLIRIILEYKINDLHEGNFYFNKKNSEIVLIDYSGYGI